MAGAHDPGGFWPAVPDVPDPAPSAVPAQAMNIRQPLPKLETQLIQRNMSYPRAVRRAIVELIEPTGLWANGGDIHRDMGRWAHSLGYGLFDIDLGALPKEQRKDNVVTSVSLTAPMWNRLRKAADFHGVGLPTAFFGMLCAYLSLQADRLGITWSKESEWLTTTQWFRTESQRRNQPDPPRL